MLILKLRPNADDIPCAAAQALRRNTPRVNVHFPNLVPEWADDLSSAIVCGGLSGMCMWTAVLPIDVAKTCIQTATRGSQHDVSLLRMMSILKNEGAGDKL